MIALKNVFCLKITVTIILCSCLFAGCSNFHEVSKDTLYRSGQLSASQFDKYIHKYGIKTVINLRGPSPQDKWYKEELASMQKNGVRHFDIDLTATKYVPPAMVDSMIMLASSAPKPILVHCKAGSDRTGLFCAAWRYKIDHQQMKIASKQLSFFYGHIPFFMWSKTDAMDNSFYDYVKENGGLHN